MAIPCKHCGIYLKVSIINTFDIAGGAARAANRLHNALKDNAVDSSMFVMSKTSTDPSVVESGGYTSEDILDQNYVIRRLIQKYYIDNSRTDLSNTLFSFAYPGKDLSANPLVKSADIINLHWIGWFQTPVTIHNLLQLGKPVIWTLHDMNPFTGGCHYSAGCDGYMTDCRNCLQLSRDPYSLPHAILKDKLELFGGFQLTIVTPSRWLARCARNSALFRDCRVEIIPNCIETDIYTPQAKGVAKASFDIDPQTVVLMFGADSSNERRKGFEELEAALALARNDPVVAGLVREKKFLILTLGPLTADMSKLGLDVKALGHVNDDTLIARAYSAADIYVLPSLEDNLPNMMLESMACGTPVLAFNTGGIPDVVTDGVNGRLVATGDTVGLAARLIELVRDKGLREKFGEESAMVVSASYSPTIQAVRYRELFSDLIRTTSTISRMTTGTTEKTESYEKSDYAYGPGFDAIKHKVMFDALLKSIPELCQAHAPTSKDANPERIGKLQHEIAALHASLSWRMTAPLRKLLDIVKSMSRKL